MRLHCPHCGQRDSSEFDYRGDARPLRPDPQGESAQSKFHDYVYQRDNPAGWLEELWYHEGGCRSWIMVERNTLTHAVRGSRQAAENGDEQIVTPDGGSGEDGQ